MTESRRGSVTGLLQGAADLYSPPSPRHIPLPHPDCWDDTRGLRMEREKLAASSRFAHPTPPTGPLSSLSPALPSSPNSPIPIDTQPYIPVASHSPSLSPGGKDIHVSLQHESHVPKESNGGSKKLSDSVGGKLGKERAQDKSNKLGGNNSRVKHGHGKQELGKGNGVGGKAATSTALRGTKAGRGGGGSQIKEPGTTPTDNNNKNTSSSITDQVISPSKPRLRKYIVER